MTLSLIVYFSPMSDCNDDGGGFFIENHPPITYAKARTLTTLESFHVTLSAYGKLSQTNVDTSANLRGKFHPLPSACRRKENRLHD